MSKNFELIQQAGFNLKPGSVTDSPAPMTEELSSAKNEKTSGIRKTASTAAELNVDKLTQEESLKLVQNVFLHQATEAPRCVVFAGIDHGNGCSHLCAQAAEILADNITGSVCLVEANLRSPSLPSFFGTTNHHGLTDALLHEDSIKNYAKKVSTDRLWLLSSGSMQAKTAGMLNSEQMKARVKELRSEFDYLIIDSPPLNGYSDAIALGELADGLILVLEANSTRREAAMRVAESLRTAKIHLLGAVLNKRTFPIPQPLYNLL
jgi:Mrp family chromosome partitioning ATPase